MFLEYQTQNSFNSAVVLPTLYFSYSFNSGMVLIMKDGGIVTKHKTIQIENVQLL